MAKIAIAVMAGLDYHSDMARVVNALHAAKDFKTAGEEVAVFFEGAGVVSAVTLADPSNDPHRPFALIQDKVIGLCRACSRSFGVVEKAEALGLTFLADFEQHPSWRRLIAEGYQILTF